MSKKSKMLIIDGKALIYRSFYALPPTMSTKEGEQVNAVYGFTTVLIKAINEFDPDYMVLTMDKKGPTFRHKKYEDYKATREKAPQDLYDQIPRIKQIAEIFGVPVYEKQEYEADDLIGTISKQVDSYIEKIIVTGDLDTLQLINDHTKVYTMSRGVTESVLYDIDKVKERYGLTPQQMIDFKALAGDASDNIPGVRGIGEKTAIDLLLKFKGLDAIYKYLESGKNEQEKKIKPQAAELLKQYKEQAYTSQDLATIRCDVDMDFNVEEARFEGIDKERGAELFSELEFKSLLPRIKDIRSRNGQGENGEIDKFDRNEDEFDYKIIEKEEDFRDFLTKIKEQKRFTFDVETTAFDPLTSNLLGVSFSWQAGRAYYLKIHNEEYRNKNENIDLFNYAKEEQETAMHPWLRELKGVFENESIKKIGHNIKFDVRVMQAQGIDVAGIYFDTMIASYLLNPGSRQHGLDAVVFSELGFEKISKEDLLGKGRSKQQFQEVELRRLGLYSCEDADFTHRLINPLKKQLQDQKMWDLFRDLEMPLVGVLARMENDGVLLEPQVLQELHKEVSDQIKGLEQKIHKSAGTEFNISSPQQLKEVLYKTLDISTENISKTKTGYSTAAAELDKIKDQHEIVPLIQEHRELEKLLNTYIDVLPKLVNPNTGRIHTSFNQTVTATGRLSSTDPNLQNMPIKTELGRKIRRAFTAPAGYKIVSLDYSQIELRLAAHLSGDKKMIEAFRNNEDIHTTTAAEINNVSQGEVTKEMRREAKAINFGILYGQGPFGLSQTADIPMARAKEFIEQYFNVFQGVKEYIEKCIQTAETNGYVETMFGRKRYVPEIGSEVPRVRKGAERIAINTPLQGSSADMIKKAMIEVQRFIDRECKNNDIKMLIQVHDELLFEIKEEMMLEEVRQLKRIMQEVIDLQVPIEVDIEVGDNWGELKKMQE
jgi:DNA polymerase-1